MLLGAHSDQNSWCWTGQLHCFLGADCYDLELKLHLLPAIDGPFGQPLSNPDQKSEYLAMCLEHKFALNQDNQLPLPKIDNDRLPFIQSVKYPRLNLDHHLTWHMQAQRLHPPVLPAKNPLHDSTSRQAIRSHLYCADGFLHTPCLELSCQNIQIGIQMKRLAQNKRN